MKQIKNTNQKNKSGNNWLYDELGIYNPNPEKDKKINDELKLFLKSIGYKPARVIIKNEFIFQ